LFYLALCETNIIPNTTWNKYYTKHYVKQILYQALCETNHTKWFVKNHSTSNKRKRLTQFCSLRAVDKTIIIESGVRTKPSIINNIYRAIIASFSDLVFIIYICICCLNFIGFYRMAISFMGITPHGTEWK
jgi:hypothetical protein